MSTSVRLYQHLNSWSVFCFDNFILQFFSLEYDNNTVTTSLILSTWIAIYQAVRKFINSLNIFFFRFSQSKSQQWSFKTECSLSGFLFFFLSSSQQELLNNIKFGTQTYLSFPFFLSHVTVLFNICQYVIFAILTPLRLCFP
jgi:hypothetical protein